MTVDHQIIRSRNPWTGESNGEVPATAPTQVAGIVRQAHQASSMWAGLSFAERGAFMVRARQRFLGQAAKLATLLHDENGKPETEAYFSEILPNADLFSYYVAQTAKLLADERVKLDPFAYPGKRGWIRHEPKGVIAVISPWNFPIALPLRVIVPALMAGNTVVFKPSEHTPLCGAAIAEIFADLPAGVFHLVQGGPDVGRALVAAAVDHVHVTGSVRAGREVALRCAERLITCSLELGGKDAAIVLSDADLDRAADGIAWGAMMNGGQNCAGIERIYVEAAVAEPFLDKLAARVEALGEQDVGPVQNVAQLALVRRHLDQAKADGARIVAAVRRAGGQIGPTVLTDCPADSPVMQEETFGPLVTVIPVDSAGEAIQRTNASPYGLTASIWSRDQRRAEALAADLHVGTVTINNHGFTGALANAPWSGRKQSGIGATNSHLALKDMVHAKFMLVDRHRAKDLWWFPHNAAAGTIVKAMTTLKGGPGSKVAALGQLLPALIGRWRR